MKHTHLMVPGCVFEAFLRNDGAAEKARAMRLVVSALCGGAALRRVLENSANLAKLMKAIHPYLKPGLLLPPGEEEAIKDMRDFRTDREKIAYFSACLISYLEGPDVEDIPKALENLKIKEIRQDQIDFEDDDR